MKVAKIMPSYKSVIRSCDDDGTARGYDIAAAQSRRSVMSARSRRDLDAISARTS